MGVISRGLGHSSVKVTETYLKPFGDKIGRVELLPYHTLGAAKWERLGLDYGLKGVEPTSPETAAEFRKALAGILPETEIV
mgnify:CR=1 FL=1